MIWSHEQAKPFPWPVAALRTPPERRGLWRDLVLAVPFWDIGQRWNEDVSGYGLHGVWGSTMYSTHWITGEVGPELDFNGNVGQYVEVPNDPLLDGTPVLSVEITWRAKGTLTGFEGLVGKYRPSTGYRSWRFYYDNGALELQVSSNGTSFEDHRTTGLSLVVGTTYQTVFVFNAGAFSVWNNGQAAAVDANFTSQTSIYAGLQNLLIGQRRTSSDLSADTYNGAILSLRIWRRALDAEDVRQLSEDPFGMYRPDWAVPSLAVEHSGAQAAGPWLDAGEVNPGVQELLIPGLANGTSYDVQAFTRDTTGNISPGSSIVAGTPAVAASTYRGARIPIVAAPRRPPFLSRWR